MAEKINLPGVTGEWYGDEVLEETERRIDKKIEIFARKIAQGAKASVSSATGNLAKGIDYGRSKFQKIGSWVVWSSAPHSILYEKGTQERKNKKGANRGVMGKRGLIWPQYDKYKREFLESLKGLMD